MKIIAFGASNSRNSINKRLATYAGERLAARHPGSELEVLDLNDFEAPLYGIDHENEKGIPEAPHRFLEKLAGADVLVISMAEHNGSYTAAFKSLLDWMTRISRDVFGGKPALLLSTSPGKGGGASVLRQATESFGFFKADIKGSLAVPSFNASFDSERGELADAELSSRLEAALEALTS